MPRWFSLWKGGGFVFAHDFGAQWPDEKLWHFAKCHSLTIVTRDADFRARADAGCSSPKVVHVRLGNMKMRTFFEVMTARWPDIVAQSQQRRLIEVWPDRIAVLL